VTRRRRSCTPRPLPTFRTTYHHSSRQCMLLHSPNRHVAGVATSVLRWDLFVPQKDLRWHRELCDAETRRPVLYGIVRV